MNKAYVLITNYSTCSPDMELFSKLPMMAFPTDEDITSQELYEGYIDGGDTRPILILDCYTCSTRRATVRTRVSRGPDPSEIYTLTCGHDVLAGC